VRRMGGSAADGLNSFGKPNVLHDNGMWLPHNHSLAKLAKQRSIPRIVSTRGMLEPWALKHKKWKKKTAWLLYQKRDLASSSCHHATAEPEARNIGRLGLGVSIAVIPNGVDLPAAPIVRNPENSGKTALFLGRIYPVKGLPMLVEAWAQVRPPGWKLWIAGPDEAGHRVEVEQTISAAGLEDIVSFLGPLEGRAKQRAFCNADLFVLPSHSESFGMAVAEALAHGLPVLTTSATPWPMLHNHDCGWCVDPSVSGLAEGLRRVTSYDPAALRAMGERGHALVAKEFDWTKIAMRFLETYEAVLNQTPCSRSGLWLYQGE
jgi:glycosyltransferase involved in cell wall biosynthesis